MSHHRQQQHHDEVEEMNINADADADDVQSVVNSEFSRIGDGATDNNHRQQQHQRQPEPTEEELMNNNGNGQNFGGGNAFYGSLGGSLLNMSMGTSAAGTDDYQKMYSVLMKKIRALETENINRKKEQFTAKEIIEMIKKAKQKQQQKLEAFKAEMVANITAAMGQQQSSSTSASAAVCNPAALAAVEGEVRLLEQQKLTALEREVAALKMQNGQLTEKLASQDEMGIQLAGGLALQSDEIEKQREHMETVLAQIRELLLTQDRQQESDGGSLLPEEQFNTAFSQLAHLWEHHHGEVCYVHGENRWNDAIGQCGADLAVTIDKLTINKEKNDMTFATIRAVRPFMTAAAAVLGQKCRRAYYFEMNLKNLGNIYNFQAFVGLNGPRFMFTDGNEVVGKLPQSSFAVHFFHNANGAYTRFWDCGTDCTNGFLPMPAGQWANGHVFGIGLLKLANGQRQLFVTKNGAIFGKPRLLPTDTDSELYPTVTLHGQGTSLEANFGNDPAKPFRYDLRTHPGLDN